MIDEDRLKLIDTGDGVPLTKCEQNLYEALANMDDGVFSGFTKPRLEDALADMSELVAEVKQKREMVRNYQQELESLRELNALLCGKWDILNQLKGFDEILGLIG